MYVGVILNARSSVSMWASIPHVCGGDPILNISPAENVIVFPMYVGVILIWKTNRKMNQRIPHVCGGDPLREALKTLIE